MDTRNSAPSLPAGTKLFGYEVVEKLGSGAFGIVYRATLLEIGGTVAIKEFLPAQLARRRPDGCVEPLPDQVDAFQWSREQFRKEARTLRALADPEPHPNIIKVELVFEANDTVYFSMRWEEGRPLDEVLTPAERWPEAKLRTLLLALLDGLRRVHEAQVLHRDIKPNNLLVRPDGSPVLIDFGAARRVVGDATQSRFIVQTPGFAPPEQAWGEYGPWTDIYSLAAALFYVLTGEQPVAFTEQRRFLAKDLAGIYSASFLCALDAALEPDHRRRPQSVAEWRRLFEPERDTLATVVMPRPQPAASTADTVAAPAPSREERLAASQAQAHPGAEPDRAATAPPAAARPPRGRGLAITIGALLATAAVAVGVWLWQPWVTETGPDIDQSTGDEPLRQPTAGAKAEPKTEPVVARTQAPAGDNAATTPVATPTATPPRPTSTPPASPTTTAPLPPAQQSVSASASEPPPPPKPETAAEPLRPEAPKAPPALPPASPSVRAAAASLDCARIKLTEVGERSFKMSGYVGGPATMSALRDALRRIPSIRVDIGGIEVLSPPVCATLHAMRAYKDPSAPIIRTSHANGRYAIGDVLSFSVQNHDRRSGRLHVFYVSAAGEVMAVPTSFRRLLYKGESVREEGFDVGGPVGADLLLAVWCRGGVELPQSLAEDSTSSDFLPRLRAAMDASGECNASSAVIHITR
ncbi:MAG: serine/threonine-protein kinase [Thiohalocapsa sp.]|jgi:predicted Ser/Thr protein kinase|uniref:serine/threonine protein kinase n=1 Tax=Thiohalocapsa sp. TaxID=2497641 RepID=UPI0025D4B257|nr:serine/threonine protein kinase [Thiohalocapsa sp.]MCG6942073.1 serine/threonine-protein kinase [Thiohalocapsa sp.]